MRTWLDSYRNCKGVTFSLCDPPRLLAEYLRTAESEIPKELREDPLVIVSAGLLDKAQHYPLRHGQHVASWVLEHTLGSLWAQERLAESSQLSELLRECMRLDGAALAYPSILALRRHAVEGWAESPPYGHIIRWIFEDHPGKRSKSLVLFSLLRGYPADIQTRALVHDNHWNELATLDGKENIAGIVDLNLVKEISLPSPYSKLVRTFLEDKVSKNGNLRDILPFISGHLKEEYDTVEDFLKRHMANIDFTWDDLLREIDVRFSQAPNGEKLAELARRIRPVRKPDSLAIGTEWRIVRKWLGEQYFPFYSWSLNVERVEETVDAVADFEAWLHDAYDDIGRCDAYQPYAVRQHMKTLTQRMPTLLIVLDGLSWLDGQEWVRLLADNGMGYVDCAMALTTIPTITPVAKPSLVRGQLPGQLDRTEQRAEYYARQLSESLGIPLTDMAFASFSDRSITELVREKKRVYLFMYNEIDGQLHKPQSPVQRRTIIASLLRSLAESLSEARKEFRARHHEDFAIVTASDHGYTELPDKAAKKISLEIDEDSTQVVDRRVLWCKSKGDMETSPDLWRIGQDLLKGTDYTFDVARGYGYINSKPHGATHGGLTPQEVTVATVTYDPTISVTYSDISINIEGEIRRGRASNPVRIAFSSSNLLPVEVSAIHIRLTQLQGVDAILVTPGSVEEVAALVDAANIRETMLELSGTIATSMRGIAHRQEVKITVRTTGAAVADQAFEDEFNA
jgi:hypothetical protein